MGILEISIAVTGCIMAVTVCCVKVLAQLENSRCTSISCCKDIINCTRDLSTEVKEVEMPVRTV